MAKSRQGAADSGTSLRSIPSVERILSATSFRPLIESYGRPRVKEFVVEHLGALRAGGRTYDEAEALSSARVTLDAVTSSTLVRLINGTGIIIHTNLGRAPIDASLWRDAAAIVAGYSNIEFDLESGERGAREEHLTAVCRGIFGSEAALLTNNNAAATMLIVAATAARKEVIVSRGELVEIGGAFRVPDVIQQGGAKLREVGTTNRTRASDYAEAVSRRTAAILRVHRSNFDIVGFTETPQVRDLAAVAREKNLPLLYDEGSGAIVDIAQYGFARKETIAELLAAGVDLVSCSTDKLIGATQGGLILGREELIAKCRRHPLMRAVRAGKESYAIVAATLHAFATARHEELVPVYRMLSLPLERLRARAEDLVRGTRSRVVESRCALGGGTTPTETIASIAVELAGDAERLQKTFRERDVPIIGRIHDGSFLLDVRTLLEDHLPLVRQALRELAV